MTESFIIHTYYWTAFFMITLNLCRKNVQSYLIWLKALSSGSNFCGFSLNACIFKGYYRMEKAGKSIKRIWNYYNIFRFFSLNRLPSRVVILTEIIKHEKLMHTHRELFLFNNFTHVCALSFEMKLYAMNADLFCFIVDRYMLLSAKE